MPIEILIPDQTRARLTDYEASVGSGTAIPGRRLTAALREVDNFTTALLRTKLPQIFAESAVAGDGSDWNLTELGLLGDISVAMEVTVFDDGRHSDPEVHAEPFEGGLVFVPGALLRSGGPGKPADWDEVVDDEGRIDPDAYDALYARRLLPGFRWIEERAKVLGQPALVTIPGLGQARGPSLRPSNPRLGIWDLHCCVHGLDTLIISGLLSLQLVLAPYFSRHQTGQTSRDLRKMPLTGPTTLTGRETRRQTAAGRPRHCGLQGLIPNHILACASVTTLR